MTDVAEFITIARIRDGKPFAEEVMVEYADGLLTIRGGWSERKQDFREVREYRVEACESPMGRAFHLYRDAEAVEKDPDHELSYWLLIGAESRCDCKGKAATERQGRECKHVAALRHLLTIGAL